MKNSPPIPFLLLLSFGFNYSISSPAVIFVVVCRLDPEILGWTNQLTTLNSIKTVALCACFFFSFLSMPSFLILYGLKIY